MTITIINDLLHLNASAVALHIAGTVVKIVKIVQIASAKNAQKVRIDDILNRSCCSKNTADDEQKRAGRRYSYRC
jgi:hypothetical protein